MIAVDTEPKGSVKLGGLGATMSDMASFRLVPAAGLDKPRVFLGDDELDAQQASYSIVNGRPAIYLRGRLKPEWLAADLPARDSGIEVFHLENLELLLLRWPWRARILIGLTTHIVVVQCSPIWERWTSVISFQSIRKAFRELIVTAETNIMDVGGDDDLTVRLTLESAPPSLTHVIRMCERYLSETLANAFEHAASQQPTAVVSVFEFPSEVRSACEQYLLHFVDFLRDVGVHATADLRHEAERVLFTVTPDNPKQALQVVRDALTAYLQLVGAELQDASATSEEQITIDRLQMNILHLKSQLTAAGMMLRLQEATITSQELTIDAQRRLIAGGLGSRDGSEVLIPGIVDILPVQSHGFRVNLPELLRRLKRVFASRR